MPSEIEHKYLIQPKALPRPLPAGKRIVQGYLSLTPAVRVRIASLKGTTKAYLTIKGPGLRQRSEFEYEIPVAHARQLMKLCGAHTLSKIRYQLGNWEVDQFVGRHKGLWLAEYELPSIKARMPKLPEWIDREVTGDKRYVNTSLVLQQTAAWK